MEHVDGLWLCVMILKFIHIVAYISGHSFLLLINIPLFEYNTICFPVYLLANIWVISSFG